MDTAILVKDARQAGWALLEKLDLAKFPMQAAFWQYLQEGETWRLFIATALVEVDGPIAAYTQLQEQLNEMYSSANKSFDESFNESLDELSIMDISLISPQSEQIAQLKRRYGTVEKHPHQVRRIELSKVETYIYFIA